MRRTPGFDRMIDEVGELVVGDPEDEEVAIELEFGLWR